MTAYGLDSIVAAGFSRVAFTTENSFTVPAGVEGEIMLEVGALKGTEVSCSHGFMILSVKNCRHKPNQPSSVLDALRRNTYLVGC